jgi:hypothetical protein
MTATVEWHNITRHDSGEYEKSTERGGNKERQESTEESTQMDNKKTAKVKDREEERDKVLTQSIDDSMPHYHSVPFD